MWFATYEEKLELSVVAPDVAIPLRGYVVCNLVVELGEGSDGNRGRNPLTGLCGLQLEEVPSAGSLKTRVAIPLRGYVVCNLSRLRCRGVPQGRESQSPYGAMWFATLPP